MCSSKVLVNALALVAAASFVLIAALAQTPKRSVTSDTPFSMKTGA